MQRVINLLVLNWLIERLLEAKGEKYTLLPISHRWDRSPRSSMFMPNLISGQRLTSRNNFANKVASRKWQHSIRATVPWADAGDPARSRLNVFDVGFKPYLYSDPTVSLYRTALGLQILDEIEELGDVCGVLHRGCCVCTVLAHNPGQHPGRHHSDTCTW